MVFMIFQSLHFLRRIGKVNVVGAGGRVAVELSGHCRRARWHQHRLLLSTLPEVCQQHRLLSTLPEAAAATTDLSTMMMREI